MLILIIISITIILWILVDRWKNRSLVSLSKIFKTDLTWIPIIGHAYLCIGNNEEKMNFIQTVGREAIKNNGHSSIWLGSRFFVVVADPQTADFVAKNCLHKDDTISRLSHFFTGNGTVFAPVPIWRPRRKILAPIFSPKNLNNFVNVFATQSAMMVEHLQPLAGTGPIAFGGYLPRYTLRSICESMLGSGLINDDLLQRILKSLEDSLAFLAQRILQPWMWNDVLFRLYPLYYKMKRARDSVYNEFEELIRKKRVEVLERSFETQVSLNLHDKEKQETMKSILELLIQESGGAKGYSVEELREESVAIVTAGTEFSTIGVGFTAVMLAQYPEEQDKIYQELREVFGTSERLVTKDDIPKLKYLEAFIRECLRLYPPLPITARKITEDLTLPSGVTLVEGSAVVLHIWAINRNPRYWGADAEQFRPSRFLEPMRHPAQFMAFGCGPRNCLGYQYTMRFMKTALATLLRRYRVVPADAARAQKQLRLKFDIMMKDVDNYTVQLEPRTVSKA